MNREHKGEMVSFTTPGNESTWVTRMFKINEKEFGKLYPPKPEDWQGVFKEEITFDVACNEKDYTVEKKFEGLRGGGKTELGARLISEEIKMVKYISDFSASQNTELFAKLKHIFKKVSADVAEKCLLEGNIVPGYAAKPELIPYGNSPIVVMGKGSGFA